MDDDLACPSCGGQGIEVGIFENPANFFMECSCGWTCEGAGTNWRARLVPYEGDSTDGEVDREWPQEGWPLTSEADGPGEPPGW